MPVSADDIGRAFGFTAGGDAPPAVASTAVASPDRIREAFALDRLDVKPIDFRVANLRNAAENYGPERTAMGRYEANQLMGSVPFVGMAVSWAGDRRLREAVERVAAGTATGDDYDLVAEAQTLEERKENRGYGRSALEGVVEYGGQAAELMTGMYAAGAARHAALRTLPKAVGGMKGVQAAAGLGQAIGVGATQGAARGLPKAQMPSLALDTSGDTTTVKTEDGADFADALMGSAAGGAVSGLVEQYGGAVIGKLIPGRVKNAVVRRWLSNGVGRNVKSLNDTLKSVGWNGVFAELGEERLDEIVQGAIGTQGDFGLTGQAAGAVVESVAEGSFDPLAEEAPKIGRQLTREAAGIGAIGGSVVAAGAAMSMPEIASRVKQLPPAVLDKIRRGVALSRKDATDMGVDVPTGATERQAFVDETLRTASEAADRLIRERPWVAEKLIERSRGRGFLTDGQYERAAGEAPPFPGYDQIVLDTLLKNEGQIAEAKAAATPDPNVEPPYATPDIPVATRTDEPAAPQPSNWLPVDPGNPDEIGIGDWVRVGGSPFQVVDLSPNGKTIAAAGPSGEVQVGAEEIDAVRPIGRKPQPVAENVAPPAGQGANRGRVSPPATPPVSPPDMASPGKTVAPGAPVWFEGEEWAVGRVKENGEIVIRQGDTEMAVAPEDLVFSASPAAAAPSAPQGYREPRDAYTSNDGSGRVWYPDYGRSAKAVLTTDLFNYSAPGKKIRDLQSAGSLGPDRRKAVAAELSRAYVDFTKNTLGEPRDLAADLKEIGGTVLDDAMRRKLAKLGFEPTGKGKTLKPVLPLPGEEPSPAPAVETPPAETVVEPAAPPAAPPAPKPDRFRRRTPTAAARVLPDPAAPTRRPYRDLQAAARKYGLRATLPAEQLEPLVRREEELDAAQKKPLAVKREDIEAAYPFAKEVSQVDDDGRRHRVTLPNGEHFDVAIVDEIQVRDVDRFNRSRGKDLTPEQAAQVRATGAFRLHLPDGEYDGLGLVMLANRAKGDGNADPVRTARHELLHLARKTGMLTPREWRTLIRKHSKPGLDPRRQEEDVARAVAAWSPPEDLLSRSHGWVEKLLSAAGVRMPEADVAEAMLKSRDFWSRPADRAAGLPINQLRAELAKAGIPVPQDAAKEELADLYRGWEDELAEAAADAEVSVESLRARLDAAYRREEVIAAQHDAELGDRMTEYRAKHGLNAQAMGRSDWKGWPRFDEIAASFVTETGGPRPGLETTEDVWELFKRGKRRPTTYRELLSEALDDAAAEQLSFDPDAFDEAVVGMPTIASTGTRIPWKYAGTPGAGRAPSGAAVIAQVIKAAHAFGKASGTAIPLRVGRVRSRKAAGQFDTRQFVARVRQANDSVTAAHELGHGIERALRGREPWENLVPLEVLGDLTGLGREAYPKGPPHNGWASEGVAELVMRFVHDPEGLAKNYRHAAGWFEATVLAGNPKGAKHLRAASRLGVRYRDAGSVGRGLSTTVRSGSAEDLTIRLAQGRRRLNLKERYVEAGEPLRDAAGRFAAKRGEPLAADENPFELFKANRLTAPAVLRTAVLEAPVDARGVPVPGRRPLADIGRHVSDADLPEFELYLKALRTIAEKTKGEGRDTGLSLKDAEQIVRELKSPSFDAAAAVYYGFDDWGLDYLAEHSETLADVRDAIRKKDPGNHAPLRRIWERFEDPPEAGKSTSRTADARVGGRFKGSGRRTRPLVDSLIAQVGERIRLAHSRQVLDALVAFVPEKGVPDSGLEGIGELIEEVDPKTVPEYQARVQDVIAKLRTALREQGLDAEVFQRRTGEKVPLDDVVDDLIPFFGLERNPPGGRHILPVFRKGKVRLFELKPKLLDALKTMDEQPLEGVYGRLFFRALRAFSRVFKFGTVGGRPSFGFIVNPPRDYADWRQRTRTTANEAKELLPTFTKNLFRELLWRATRSELFDSDAAKFFRRRGLDMATPLGEDSAALRRLADRVAPVRLSEMDGLWSFGRYGRMRAGQFFDYLVDLLQFSDAAVRIGEIELLAKEHGIDLKDPTREQAIFLAIAGKEPTTDFTARGTDTAVVEAIFPFFNASVQGTAGGFRAAKRHPFRTLWRFGTAASVGLTLWLRNRDEEWWRRLPSYEKWMYLHVGVGDERLRIAVPHDWGNLYAQSLVATVDAVYQRDPEIALDYARQWVELQAPSLNPMLGEPWQQATNVDSFTGAPLVPQGLARRPAEQQAGEYTSEAAKFLGETLHWSPMRIDHAIRGVGGPLAGDVLQGVGLGFEDAREREPADLPVIGRLFARGGLQGSRPAPVDRVYELKERADLEKYRAEATGGETASQAELRLMLSRTADELTALSKARTSTKGLQERRAITAKMAEIAEAAVAAWRSATPKRGVYKDAEARARRTAR